MNFLSKNIIHVNSLIDNTVLYVSVTATVILFLKIPFLFLLITTNTITNKYKE